MKCAMIRSTFEPGHEWFEEVLPEGVAVGETTVITGPGGSGKPLVGFAVVESWLAAGGSVVFLLTNSGREFVAETMAELYDVDVADYDDQLSFVDFDPELEPTVEAIETSSEGMVRANLLDGDVWTDAIDGAAEGLTDNGPGTLVFATALNLFLFSPTYREESLEAFLETVEREDDRTYLFTVSTSAFEDDIARVESAADTVLLTEMEGQRLRLRGERSASVEVSTAFVDVPFSPEQIGTIKSVSEETRTSLIPTLKEI
jgi:KaiC/GvpD/RAD55 family RecA-like ATPase